MIETKYYCDICHKERIKGKMLNYNVFPKKKGQRASLGSKDVCIYCHNKLFKKEK